MFLPTWACGGFPTGLVPCLAPGGKKVQGTNKLFSLFVFFFLIIYLLSALCLSALQELLQGHVWDREDRKGTGVT